MRFTVHSTRPRVSNEVCSSPLVSATQARRPLTLRAVAVVPSPCIHRPRRRVIMKLNVRCAAVTELGGCVIVVILGQDAVDAVVGVGDSLAFGIGGFTQVRGVS